MNWLTGWLLPPSASSFGPQIDHLYNLVLWITGVVFVLTEAALIYFSIRYRRKEGVKALYSHGSTFAEVIWTSVPAVILIVLGIMSQNIWSEVRYPKNIPTNALVVKVHAEQWLWHFTFAGPDGIFGTADDLTVDNTFHLPVNQPVRFEVESQDVIHGFFIPALRIHQDVVPGMVGTLWAQPTVEGSYEVRCTQFCGTNHYQMKGEVTVESDDAFKAWVAGAKAEAF